MTFIRYTIFKESSFKISGQDKIVIYSQQQMKESKSRKVVRMLMKNQTDGKHIKAIKSIGKLLG